MAFSKHREMERLLGRIEVLRSHEKERERETRIVQMKRLYRFEALKNEVIFPTFRELMLRLESKGHMTRLRDLARDKVRLEFVLETKRPIRGAIELELAEDPQGGVEARYQCNYGKENKETVHLDDLNRDFVGEIILRLLRELI